MSDWRDASGAMVEGGLPDVRPALVSHLDNDATDALADLLAGNGDEIDEAKAAEALMSISGQHAFPLASTGRKASKQMPRLRETSKPPAAQAPASPLQHIACSGAACGADLHPVASRSPGPGAFQPVTCMSSGMSAAQTAPLRLYASAPATTPPHPRVLPNTLLLAAAPPLPFTKHALPANPFAAPHLQCPVGRVSFGHFARRAPAAGPQHANVEMSDAAPGRWDKFASAAVCGRKSLLPPQSQVVAVRTLSWCSSGTDIEMSDDDSSFAMAPAHSHLSPGERLPALWGGNAPFMLPLGAFVVPAMTTDQPAPSPDVEMADVPEEDTSPPSPPLRQHRRSRPDAPTVSPALREKIAAAEQAAAADEATAEASAADGVAVWLQCGSPQSLTAPRDTHRCRQCGRMPTAAEASRRALCTPRTCPRCRKHKSAAPQRFKRPIRLDEGRRRELERT